MAEFTQDILEFLQRNHFTDALAALQSELADQKSSNGCGFFNYSSCPSPQVNGWESNENHGGKQRTKSRDDESMDFKSSKPHNYTEYITFEKGITRTLIDESDSEAENLGFPCSSSKVLSNQQMDSEFKARELECDSSNHEPFTELGDANTKGTLYENDQNPISMNGYADGTLEQCKTSYEQRKLQDSAGTSEEIHMLYKGHVQFGNRIGYGFTGDPDLGLTRISTEKTKIVKELGNNMIEAKGNFYKTQDEEILKQDMPEEKYSPRKIHSRGNLWDQIERISQPDAKNHVLKEVDLDLRSHGRDYNLFIHDKKTSVPQIGNDMLDVETNNKSHSKFEQGKGKFVQVAVSAHEIAEKTPYVQECSTEKTGYRSNIGPLKGVPLKTAFPFSVDEVFVKSELLHSQALGEVAWGGSEGTVQGESKGLMSTDNGHVREGPPAQMLNSQGSPMQKKVESLNLLSMESSNELFPSLSSKTFQVADYSNNDPKEEFYGDSRIDLIASGTELADMKSSVLSGSYIHIPVDWEIRDSGKKLAVGSRQPSSYRTAQGDSGIFDNDNKQPLENESRLFSNNEIYYPCENEELRSWDREATNNKKNEHDNQILSENLYLPSKQHLQSNYELKAHSQSTSGSPMTYNYNGKLIGNHETYLLQTGPEWQGFGQQRSGLEILRDVDISHQSKANNSYFVDHHELMRSTDVGICGYKDAEINVRRNCIMGITESLSLYDKPVKYDRSSSSDNSIGKAQEFNKRQEVVDHQVVRYDSDFCRHHKAVHDSKSGESNTDKCFIEDAVKEWPDGLGSQIPNDHSPYTRGFSFPSSSTLSNVAEFKQEPEKSFISNKRNVVFFNGKKYSSHNMAGSSDIQTVSGRKSKNSLPGCSVRGEGNVDEHFNYEDVERLGIKRKDGESLNDLMKDEDTEMVDDEEAASLGQLIEQINAQRDQFETFDLQIVHRKNRTGYEEVKDYHAILNTVIAGRYHVIQNLGSAVFSNVVQVHDLHTGMDLCLKIIKNNKEYFDQCLDEIKLLKLVNKHDPADKYHLLRLHNYFYYHEHLFIVCELLKANLYEFYKFNRESGGEAYFTMPRLQSIAIQCLEALQFLHSLGLIHCDLKPENILMKSYSRCEVKVVDLGSSCFVTDYLCPTVQSRSYRAPEVILGLPYDNRIDIWSLGCILPELFLGNVLFQSDSSATLLASIISVVGPFDEEMLVMGCETHKYFTKSYALYEQNQDTNGIEFLTPKRTSLQKILQMGDQGFIDFVTFLLEINPNKRPTASAALQHPWLSYSYGPISS